MDRNTVIEQDAIALSQWLHGQDHVSIVVPLVVRIAKKTYAGARFSEDREGVYAERLLDLGELPPLYRKSRRRLAFRTSESVYDWVLTAWYCRVVATPEYDEVHPHGSHFVLTMYSSAESWASEQCGEDVRCLQMNIKEVGPTLSNITDYDTDRDGDDGQQQRE